MFFLFFTSIFICTFSRTIWNFLFLFSFFGSRTEVELRDIEMQMDSVWLRHAQALPRTSNSWSGQSTWVFSEEYRTSGRQQPGLQFHWGRRARDPVRWQPWTRESAWIRFSSSAGKSASLEAQSLQWPPPARRCRGRGRCATARPSSLWSGPLRGARSSRNPSATAPKKTTYNLFLPSWIWYGGMSVDFVGTSANWRHRQENDHSFTRALHFVDFFLHGSYYIWTSCRI